MGVMVAQHAIQDAPNTVGVAKYIVVPEPNDSITLALDDLRPFCINVDGMLPTVDLDHELRAMARKVRDEMPDRNLAPEPLLGEAFPQERPQPPLGLSHIVSKSSGAENGAVGRMMLHESRSTTNRTPPQPLPIKGRG